jgi:lipoyl(octanoyl) transferase
LSYLPGLILTPISATSAANSLNPRICWFYAGGVVPYRQAWQWQQQLVQARVAGLVGLPEKGLEKGPVKGGGDAGLPDALLMLEHPPVYTLGQGSNTKFLKFDPTHRALELHHTERGGEVTYHCPGQLLVYPIFDLRHYHQDLHWYLRQLEEVVIRTVATYGLSAQRIQGLTGVWLEGRKIAAIGIKVSRWITMHGLALNVCPDLAGFANIVPCGIADRSVGSLAEFLPEIDPEAVRQQLAIAFTEVFQLQLMAQPLADLSDNFSVEDDKTESRC